VLIMIAYVYGVVPLSLCRNGTCGVTASSSGLRLDNDSDILAMTGFLDGAGGANERSALLLERDKHDTSTVHSGSTHHRLQIQAEVLYSRRRPSIESGATTSLGEKFNYEEASTKGLAGSTYYDDKVKILSHCFVY
jgi:E3 ubiquitin-protein ligase RNF19A